MSDFLAFVAYPQGSSMLQRILLPYPCFKCFNNTSWCVCHSVFICPSIGRGVVCSCILDVMLQWTFVHRVSIEHLFSLFLFIYFSGHVISGSSGIGLFFFRKPPHCFHHSDTILLSHQQCSRAPVFPHLRQALMASLLLSRQQSYWY